ncbi:MAG: hypothetical protein ACKVZJ_01995 [Phycisphaerales bacterium]
MTAIDSITTTRLPLARFPVSSTPDELLKGFDHLAFAARGPLARLRFPTRRFLREAKRVEALGPAHRDTTDEALSEAASTCRSALRRETARAEDVFTALAVAREAARRELGQDAFAVQLAGALAVHAGCLAEMATGEGKTLTAALGAALAAWRGRGVHVVTANDYLAERDAKWMAGVYARLGLSVGCVLQSTPADERRRAYRADVTYTTNKELAADFLRDRLHASTPKRAAASVEPLLRPRHPLAHAIIDEADFVLIDDAVTPLILSGHDGSGDEAWRLAEQARDLAEHLRASEHYTIELRHRECTLTPSGQREAERLTARLPTGAPDAWRSPRRREELLTQAAEARELFINGREYVVLEGKVQIVDESTGRIMPDRTWRHGVQQAVEAKERLTPTPGTDVQARVSFQRFFRLYTRLSGMTGTAHEARGELWTTYRLPVVRLPTNRPCRREHLGTQVLATESKKWETVARHAERFAREGRPVLIGTRSVRESDELSRLLSDRGVTHEIVNAVRHQREAEVIERAGRAGAVTVATNMAGRGTDIRPDAEALAAGGLVVIATARHESARIDRQLAGRAGRQGEPGSVIEVLSLEDDLPKRHGGFFSRAISRVVPSAVMRLAQRRAERAAQRQRRQLLLHDDWLDENLGFAPEA